MFKYIRPSEGRIDWKYPLQSSMPPPIAFLPSGVKKERVLKGNLWLGSIRITTFKALEIHMNERETFKISNTTYHDGGKHSVVLGLFPFDETMQ